MERIRVIVDGAGGRMGRTITRVIAEQPDMELVGAVDAPGMPFLGQDAGLLAGVGELGVPVVDALESVIEQGDVVVEFTLPEATLANLRTVVRHQKRMVIATTGYDDAQRKELETLARQIPCVIAPNYSVGVNALLRAVALVAEVLGPDFDVEVTELHHNQKKDAPSGTALRLAEVVAAALGHDLDRDAVYGRHGITGARSRREIGIHALRGGDAVGDHTVFFIGNGERIELTHRATSRETFARGALRAVRWVMSAPAGMHDFQTVLFGSG